MHRSPWPTPAPPTTSPAWNAAGGWTPASPTPTTCTPSNRPSPAAPDPPVLGTFFDRMGGKTCPERPLRQRVDQAGQRRPEVGQERQAGQAEHSVVEHRQAGPGRGARRVEIVGGDGLDERRVDTRQSEHFASEREPADGDLLGGVDD